MSFLLVSSLALASQFVLVGEEHGVVVFRNADVPYVDLVAEGDFDAAPQAVRAMLLDYEGHPNLAGAVKVTRVLERTDNTLLVYQRLDLPVLDDRDYTMAVAWGADPDALWARYRTANDRGPPPIDGVVRMSLHEAEWRFLPLDGGRRTHAVYMVRMDLGGSLPLWICRSQMVSQVPGLFEAIRHELR